MSETIRNQTRNQLIVTTDSEQFLLGRNSFITAVITTGASLLQGMVMGRIGSTQQLIPADKDATDGSQFPVGVCIETQTALAGDTITLVNKGKIDESILNFIDTETLATLIGAANNQRSYRDYLNSIGLELMEGTELSAYDNY